MTQKKYSIVTTDSRHSQAPGITDEYG